MFDWHEAAREHSATVTAIVAGDEAGAQSAAVRHYLRGPVPRRRARAARTQRAIPFARGVVVAFVAFGAAWLSLGMRQSPRALRW